MEEEVAVRDWYLIQTFKGKEYQVQKDIFAQIKTRHLEDKVFNVFIPEKTYTKKNKKGEEKTIIEPIYPGFVFLDMIVDKETWFIIRNNITYVTGFIGSSGGGAMPTPVDPDDMRDIFKRCGIKEETQLNFKVGDFVLIKGSTYSEPKQVLRIDEEKQKVWVEVEIFGNTVEQPFDIIDVEPIDQQ